MYGFNGQHPGPLIASRQARHRRPVQERDRSAERDALARRTAGQSVRRRRDLTQDAVAPGGTFTYACNFPTRASTGITRTYARTSSRSSGFYGNMLVRSLVGGLLRAGESRGGPDARRSAARRRRVEPYGAESPTHALMGRFGNVMLVNGEPRYDLR